MGDTSELRKQALNTVTKAMGAMFNARQALAKAAMQCRMADIHDTARQMDRFYDELEQLDRDYTNFLLNQPSVKSAFASYSADSASS